MKFPFSVQKGVPLAYFSTLQLGGKARYMTRVRTKQELIEVIQFCCLQGIPFLPLGKGSNALFDDRGYNGLVILNLIDFLSLENGLVFVGAGYSFARLGVLTSKEGYSGLEFASGIPATVGGAIYMNAGAGGQETADTLMDVEWISPEGQEEVLAKEDLQFSYRTSSFQKMGGVIAGARFLLKHSVGARSHQKEQLSYRLKTQPYKQPSCGCVFRNPEGNSAGRLIEQCGLKGKSVGGVRVSEKHANFFVNMDKGTTKDYLQLIEEVKEQVFKQTGVELEEEVKVMPYE